nr:MAG TPA: hypothetical protein [Caudoviricetes sp.]
MHNRYYNDNMEECTLLYTYVPVFHKVFNISYF